MMKYVMIDSDPGTDDALAMCILIEAHRNKNIPFEIVGIVCSNGNATLDKSEKNMCRILKALNETNIPVYAGAEHPLLNPWEYKSDPFHGWDGFGDHEYFQSDEVEKRTKEEHGVNAIIRLAEEYNDRGKLTFLSLGPLTTIALALRLKQGLKNQFREIYLMGGNIEGEGNTTVSGEFNFVVDPEAAFISLNELNCPIYIAPWEVCKRCAIDLDWRNNVLGSLDTSQVSLLNKIEARILTKYDQWILCDQFAAAALVEPDVVTKKLEKHCVVELYGTHTRGMLAVDHNGVRAKPNNVTFLADFDMDLMKKMLIWAVGGQFYK